MVSYLYLPMKWENRGPLRWDETAKSCHLEWSAAESRLVRLHFVPKEEMESRSRKPTSLMRDGEFSTSVEMTTSNKNPLLFPLEKGDCIMLPLVRGEDLRSKSACLAVAMRRLEGFIQQRDGALLRLPACLGEALAKTEG
jgi:hypothetical protein